MTAWDSGYAPIRERLDAFRQAWAATGQASR